jgi:hypothetical protein
MGASKRRRIEPTHEWQLLLPLFEWPEQERYEQIRPLVLFDASVAERAAEVGTSTSTLYRRLDRFAEEGMESLFDAPAAKRRRLPPSVRRLIVDLKAFLPRLQPQRDRQRRRRGLRQQARRSLGGARALRGARAA